MKYFSFAFFAIVTLILLALGLNLILGTYEAGFAPFFILGSLALVGSFISCFFAYQFLLDYRR